MRNMVRVAVCFAMNGLGMRRYGWRLDGCRDSSLPPSDLDAQLASFQKYISSAWRHEYWCGYSFVQSARSFTHSSFRVFPHFFSPSVFFLSVFI